MRKVLWILELLGSVHVIEKFDGKVLAFNRLDMSCVWMIPVIGFFVVFSFRSKPVNLVLVPLFVQYFLKVAMRRSSPGNVINEQGSHIILGT